MIFKEIDNIRDVGVICHYFHMIRFAEVFDDLKIVQTLSGHIELHEAIRLARR